MKALIRIQECYKRATFYIFHPRVKSKTFSFLSTAIPARGHILALWCTAFFCVVRDHISCQLFSDESISSLRKRRHFILCPFMIIVFDYVGAQINKCIFAQYPCARWNIYKAKNMLNVRKITDIALKMFNFLFVSPVRARIFFAFFSPFSAAFVKKTLSFIWYIYKTNVERFMPEWRFIFTQEIRRNVCFHFARHQRGQEEKVKKKEQGNDYKIPFLTILETKTLNKANIKQANIVISMKFLKKGPTPELIAIRCWSVSCDIEQ